MLACTGCKQKKLKCDGQNPRCQNCVKGGRECLVEDPATGLHRPRDYMQSLEARVAYLEGLLREARPDVAIDHFADRDGGQPSSSSNIEPSFSFSQTDTVTPVMMTAAQSEPSMSLGNQRPEPQPAGSVDADDPADQLSADVALLCLGAAGREPHYFGPSSAVSFSRIVSATLNLPKKNGSSQHSVTSGPGGASQSSRPTAPIMFPTPTLGSALSQAYFENLHPQYPFLHRPTFHYWESVCMNANAAGQLSAAGDTALFFVWMVYAIASLTLGPGQYTAAESYYYMALEYQPAVLELDSLESIQSLLCSAVYSIRSPVGVSLWKISGVAIRHCVELGYHRSVTKYRRHSNPLIAEISKRCFWVAYDIDRVASFILGRPVGIPDEYIDAELPLDIDDDNITGAGLLKEPRASPEEPPTSMTRALHVIKLRRLWSKISHSLYSTSTVSSREQALNRTATIASLLADLDAWHESVPAPPDFPAYQPLSVFASLEWFQLAYDHSILMLYRHIITHPPYPGDEQNVEDAIATCASSAREMCILYRRVYQSPTIQFTWGSLHILFLGGLTYLYCIWRSAKYRESCRRTDIINTCMACNTVLIIIAERWSQAATYRDVFEKLSERTLDLVCNHGPAPAPEKSLEQNEDQFGFPTEALLLEDWIMDLDDTTMPHGSEWFVQELLQGMRGIQPQESTMDDTQNESQTA